ncbi:DUF3173 family protein [Enterococcus casseliflavus]|nr:DUF3173 family protein [Enterococcus casseliflavus]
MNLQTINKDDLIALGYPKATSQNIIREAKVQLVNEGLTIYLNKRLGVVPKEKVEAIIGVSFDSLNVGDKDVI